MANATGDLLCGPQRCLISAFTTAAIPLASRLAMRGVDLYTVQRAGGWKTQVMVQRSAHLSPDHMKAAVERLARQLPEGGTGTKAGTGT